MDFEYVGENQNLLKKELLEVNPVSYKLQDIQNFFDENFLMKASNF